MVTLSTYLLGLSDLKMILSLLTQEIESTKNTEVKINTLTTAFYPQGTHCRRVQRKKAKVNNYKTVR